MSQLTSKKRHPFATPLYLDRECHSSLDPLAAKRAPACLPKKAKVATVSPGGCTTYNRIATPGANEDEEEEGAKRQRAATNRQALGRARKAAGKAAPGRRTGATFEDRPKPTRGVNHYQHEISPAAETASEVEPSAQSDESTAFR